MRADIGVKRRFLISLYLIISNIRRNNSLSEFRQPYMTPTRFTLLMSSAGWLITLGIIGLVIVGAAYSIFYFNLFR
jgi:hypothetical protein